MEKTYIVTGAAGHLGGHIVRDLLSRGCRVRALVLPGEEVATGRDASNFAVVVGDIRDKGSLVPLFEGLGREEAVVIHTAAIIDITSKVTPLAYEVNVEGTKNLVELSLERGVHRFVCVSSVHAIAEPPCNCLITETKTFSPDLVEGGYAKTKAEAAAFVMDATQNRGLPGILLHPSGIIGPGDAGRNNIVETVRRFCRGTLHVCPKGGYDFVDVRDVAAACVAATSRGRVGETYILSGRYYQMTELFDMLEEIGKKKRGYLTLPTFVAKLAAPLMERAALRRGKAPLVTKYSLYTLKSRAHFSHDKASRELGFWPRDLYETLRDTAGELGCIPCEWDRRARGRKRAKSPA